MNLNKLLTTNQASKLLKLKDSSTLRRSILKGKLKATKHGRDWSILLKDLNNYSKNHTRKKLDLTKLPD